MKISDKIKGIFAKAGDEAAKVVDDSSTETPPAPKADGEQAPAWATKLEKTMARVADALAAANPSSGQPAKFGDEEKPDDKKDDKSEDAGEEKKEEKADDEKSKADDAMESRFSKLEDAVAKLCDAAGVEMSGDEAEEEESEDGFEEEEDDDFSESPAASKGMAADEKSRIEILAPGMKASGKDAKRAALMKAYESKDTKAIIEKFNGGKPVDLKKASSKTIDHLFVGVSEVVGLYRTKSFTKWKQVRDSQEEGAGSSGEMTPEKINEINAKHYANEKGVH